MRDQHLADDFKRWLDRFSPPASIKGNGMAMQDAADALLRLILRKAPRDGYTMWLAEVLELTEATMKTRAWPTMHELEIGRAHV